MNDYRIGRQPCQKYTPAVEDNGYHQWDNVHCCIYCDDDTVSFCENCRKDHHSGGYETCDLIGWQPAPAGDILWLREWQRGTYTGNEVYARVKYGLSAGPFSVPGYVVMAIALDLMPEDIVLGSAS